MYDVYLMRVLIIMIVVLMSGLTYAQQVLIDPELGDPRFPPADKIHAGCEGVVIIRSSITGSIKSLSFVIGYNPEQIRMIGRQRDQFAGSQKTIAGDRFQYALDELSTPVSGTTELARIAIASLSGVSATTLTLATGSYYVDTNNVKKILTPFTYKLSFATVPECDPDITPPRIELVSPENLSQRVIVGMPIILRIIDTDKGVDRSRVSVEMLGWRYTQTTQGVSVSGDIISIQPYEDLPHNTGVSITIKAQDTQVYGGPNSTLEQFVLQTSVKPEVCKMLGCPMGSGLLVSTGVRLSPSECQQLSRMIARPLTGSEVPMLQSRGCSAAVLSGSLSGGLSGQKELTKPAKSPSNDTPVSISLLAMMGWILFALSFILQIRYRYQYHRTKKSHQHKIFK